MIRLGCVTNPGVVPVKSSSKANTNVVIAGSLVRKRRDAAPLLESVETSLNNVSAPITIALR